RAGPLRRARDVRAGARRLCQQRPAPPAGALAGRGAQPDPARPADLSLAPLAPARPDRSRATLAALPGHPRRAAPGALLHAAPRARAAARPECDQSAAPRDRSCPAVGLRPRGPYSRSVLRGGSHGGMKLDSPFTTTDAKASSHWLAFWIFFVFTPAAVWITFATKLKADEHSLP